MKALFLVFMLLAIIGTSAQNSATKPVTMPDGRVYQMKQYYMVLLSKGPHRAEITDTAQINKIQSGHLANITRLYDMGKIVVAGPFADNGNYRGIFIFDCATQAEVEQLLATDPAIAAGRLSYEIHPWMTATNCLFK